MSKKRSNYTEDKKRVEITGRPPRSTQPISAFVVLVSTTSPLVSLVGSQTLTLMELSKPLIPPPIHPELKQPAPDATIELSKPLPEQLIDKLKPISEQLTPPDATKEFSKPLSKQLSDEPKSTPEQPIPSDITIEISFLGITIKFAGVNIDPSVLKAVLGIVVYLLVVTRVLGDYNVIRQKRSTLKALKEAEILFNKQIDTLYEMSRKSSVSEAKLIVFDDGKESEYNVFEKQISAIRESVIVLQNKYGDKIDPPLAKAFDDLYNNTIRNPTDIPKMKMLVDEVRRVGKSTRCISHESIKFLEQITIQLSNFEK